MPLTSADRNSFNVTAHHFGRLFVNPVGCFTPPFSRKFKVSRENQLGMYENHRGVKFQPLDFRSARANES